MLFQRLGYILLIVSLTLLGGYVGSRSAEGQTEAYLRTHYPWQRLGGPRDVAIKGFVPSLKSPQVLLETVDGKVLRDDGSEWVEISPEEITHVNQDLPGECTRDDPPAWLPVPRLSAKVVDSLYCVYRPHPETHRLEINVLLEDGTLRVWGIVAPTLSPGKQTIAGFFALVFACIGAIFGLFAALLLIGLIKLVVKPRRAR